MTAFGENWQMTMWDPPAEIAVLLYPDVVGATVHGLTDMFRVATTLAGSVRARAKDAGTSNSAGTSEPWYSSILLR
jgi:transcriptional regulator GlxA family with amidase domain